MRPTLVRLVLTFLLVCGPLAGLGIAPAAAQTPPAPAADAKPAAPAPATPADQPIPPAEIPDQAEAVVAELRTAEEALATDAANPRVAGALATLARDIDQRIDESQRVIAGSPALSALRGLETGWEKTQATLAEQRREVTARAAAVDKRTARLAELEKRWSATLAQVRGADTPADVRARVQDTLGAIQRARGRLDREQAEALSLLNRIASEDGRITATLGDIRKARERAVSLLFARQSAPLWHPDVIERARSEMIASGQETYAKQFAAVRDYVEEEAGTIALHAVAIALFAGLLFTIRRRVHAWAERLPDLTPAVPVFASPIAGAIVLATLASRWVYPDGPQLFWALLGAIALGATVVVLRDAADRRLLPLLNVIIAFFIVDQLRGALGTLPLAPRVLFLIEMLAGALFAARMVQSARSELIARGEPSVPPPPPPAGSEIDGTVIAEPEAPQPTARGRFLRWSRRGARLAVVFFLAAAAANAIGFTSLGEFLARAVLGGAYTGLVFYAVVLILDALALLALHARPFALSRMVRLHARKLHRWIGRGVRLAAIGLWLVLLLDRLTLRERAMALATTVLDAGVNTGSLHITVGDVIAFGVTIWASLFVARAVTFVLEEDVYPRVNLARGLPYAISSTVHYAIVVVGCLLALAALGVDMTKFTILIGALTVGIGFGLQNIINNFVSGLILLFERPVKIGDVIQLADQVGVVQRIGIRASVIRAANGADVILPNGKLISDQVTNWTRSTNVRPIDIPIAVGASAQPRDVIRLLEEAAASRDGVVAYPKPEALLAKLAADTLAIDLRFWTDRAEDWQRVRSDVALAVNDALVQAGIPVK